MSRAEDAVMRLYEDSALRGELTDEPADRLLKWAEDQLMALDATAADDAAFEAGESALHAQLKQVNRVVGTTLSAGGVMPETDAAEFGAQNASPLPAETVQAAATPDEMTLVENLIALMGADSPAPRGTVVVSDVSTQIPSAETAIATPDSVDPMGAGTSADETETVSADKLAKLGEMIRDKSKPTADPQPPSHKTQGERADE